MKSLIKYKIHLIALATVTLWGLFSYAYIGIEDGSSGLSFLSWLCILYFYPGLWPIVIIKGAYTNSDLVIAAFLSWMIYSITVTGLVHIVFVFINKKAPRLLLSFLVCGFVNMVS